MRNVPLRRIVTVACALVCVAASTPSLGMLSTLAPGAWEVRYRDSGGTRKMCLRNGREFLQLRHQGKACDRVVVSDNTGEVTVQYTCRGAGYGRTTIRKETPALIQISSQGVAEGKPFQFSAEARRSGTCAR